MLYSGCLLLHVVGCASHNQCWEYKTVHKLGRLKDSDVELNQLGKERWEAVCFAHPPANASGGDLETYYLFKRIRVIDK